MPKMMKKEDPFAVIKREAEEAGININKGTDGTYTGFMAGGATLEEYADPRELLDDLLALKEMDAADSVYTYDSDEFDEAVVSVNGGKTFKAPSFAAAFAAAKESVLEKVKPAKAVEPEEEEAPKAKAKRAYTKKAEQHISSEDEGIGSAMAPAEPEILPAVKPNGGAKAGDISNTLAEACLTMAQTLTELAGKLRSSDALLPFRGSDFTEDDPVSERKVLRTTRGK